MRLRPLVLALGCVPLLASCATTSLWNSPGETVYGDDGRPVLRPRVFGAQDFLSKLLLTPFAIAFDVCTSPLQALLLEGDSDPLIEVFGGDTD